MLRRCGAPFQNATSRCFREPAVALPNQSKSIASMPRRTCTGLLFLLPLCSLPVMPSHNSPPSMTIISRSASPSPCAVLSALAPIVILPENGLGGEIVKSVNHDSEPLAPVAIHWYVPVPGGPKRPNRVMPRDIRGLFSASIHENWDYVYFLAWARLEKPTTARTRRLSRRHWMLTIRKMLQRTMNAQLF